MNDADLVKKIKEIGANEKAVRLFLLESLSNGDISTQQLKEVLDKPSKDFPQGLHFEKDANFICKSPSFITSVITEFKRINGNKKAFCC